MLYPIPVATEQDILMQRLMDNQMAFTGANAHRTEHAYQIQGLLLGTLLVHGISTKEQWNQVIFGGQSFTSFLII